MAILAVCSLAAEATPLDTGRQQRGSLRGMLGADGGLGFVSAAASSFLEIASAKGHAGSCASLANKGSHFTVEIGVGTPEQTFEVVADTGSNNVIIPSCICVNVTRHCDSKDDCFTGTNHSSTFAPPPPNSPYVVISFGSGDIEAAIATDVVRVGSTAVTMKDGLLLMVDKALDMAGPFEGILGLGVPQLLGATGHTQLMTASDAQFISKADVSHFSICFNDGSQPGALRLEVPAAPGALLAQQGATHWSLDFKGFSVGSASAPAKICTGTSPSDACSAIPDSGTTLMMGPKAHILALFAEICERWPRCMAGTANSTVSKALLFQQILLDCESWLTQDQGINEVPSLFINLVGSDGQTQVLELTGWAYITESLRPDVEIVTKHLGNIFPIKVAVSKGHKSRVCTPSFGQMDFSTSSGPAWILGTPLFYQFQVVFGRQPPSIGFTKEACDSCGGDGSAGLLSSAVVSGARPPRRLAVPPRVPWASSGFAD